MYFSQQVLLKSTQIKTLTYPSETGPKYIRDR